MATVVYFLCALTSTSCAVLLFNTFWEHRRRATRLVLWSSCCFAWFAVSNVLVFTDLVVLPTIRLDVARAATACIGSSVLLFGLIWETE
jgi:hypothetical protein